MKAAVVREFGQPLVLEDRPIPSPGRGQVTVRMEASGLCHTDIHAANGDWPVKPTPPFVPGHEGVGIVHATGDGPTGLAAISGVGGLGHLAVQYAKIFGGTVAAIEVTDEKLQLAKELGADITIDARTEDPAEVLQSHGGADVAIGLAVDDKSFAAAYAGLRRGGRLVLVALPAAGTLPIPVFDTVLNGTSVIGSIVGTRADLLDVLALQ